MPSIWGPARAKKPKPRGYESNATQLLQANPSARALQSARVEAEARIAKQNGRLPTVAEVQARHPFTPEAAEKLIRATKRALAARSKTLPAAIPGNAAPKGRVAGDMRGVSAPEQIDAAHLRAVLVDIRRRFGEEIRLRGEQTAVPEGFVYLATHPCFEGWVKAGMTIDYELRLGTYNVADPLSRFEFRAVRWTANRRNAEAELLRLLARYAAESRGEWFRIALDDAMSAFGEVGAEE